jgi:hypothetical protein
MHARDGLGDADQELGGDLQFEPPDGRDQGRIEIRITLGDARIDIIETDRDRLLRILLPCG